MSLICLFQREIVTGLKFVQKLSRMGVTVDKYVTNL